MRSRNRISRRDVLKWFALLGCAGMTLVLPSGCRKSDDQEGLSLEISCDGNNLAFDKTTLRAPAGQLVRVSFHNVSTTFQHNWVLVAGGEAVAQQVNQAATAAGADAEYLPADMSQIVAHTKLISRGKSDTVIFTAPTTAGDYVYLCTFPGHYLAGMKGNFVVTA